MPSKPFNIEFPLGGVDRVGAVRNQRPFTTPDALNVRPQESLSGRTRGGSRPGLKPVINNVLGSGNPIRFISELTETLVNEDDLTDGFPGTVIQDTWTAATWLDSGVLHRRAIPSGDGVWGGISDNNLYGNVLTTVLNIDETAEYRIALQAQSSSPITEAGVPSVSTGQFPGEPHMFLRMDDATPTLSLSGGAGDGIQVRWYYDKIGDVSKWHAEIKVIESGVISATTTLDSSDLAGDLPLVNANGGSPLLEVVITANTLEAFYIGTSIGTFDMTPYTFVGKSMGFGHDSGGTENGFGAGSIQSVAIYYTPDIEVQNNRIRLIASSNGSLWKTRTATLMDAVSSTYTLDVNNAIQTVEYANKLYIAEYTEAASAIDGTLTGTPDLVTLRSATLSAEYADFTSQTVFNADDHVVVITSGTSSGVLTVGVYTISSLSTALITLNGAPETVSTTAIKFRIVRRPMVYDSSTDTLEPWDVHHSGLVSGGLSSLPHECKLISRYRGRITLAGDQVNPNLFYMSRSGDPGEWSDFGVDSLSAISGSTTEANVIGKPISALVPHADDYQIMGCFNELWIIRGDLSFGGQIDRLSDNVGIVSADAWTKGPGSEVYFLSRQGLYVVQPGDTPYPAPISEKRIPAELSRLPRDVEAYLGYDSLARGISIFVTTPNGTDTNYFYHLETQSFWPEIYHSTMTPTSIMSNADTIASDGGLIIGHKDGWVRSFFPGQRLDHSTAYSSYVYFGPFYPGGTTREGILSEIKSFMSDQAYDDATWEIFTGETAEIALANKTASATGTWSGGMSLTDRPQIRANAMYIKLSSTSGAWQVERIYGKSIRGGEHR